MERTRLAFEVVKCCNFLHAMPPPYGPILHRDIKSLNFLLDDRLSVRVADFGLSKLQHSIYNTSSMLQGAGIAGTVQWMAPEVFSAADLYTDKSDVFSIGVVLWEVATGEKPWDRKPPAVIAGAVCAGKRLNIPDRVPAFFREWIEDCWWQEPTQRPSCGQLLDSIEQRMRLLQESTGAGKELSSAAAAAALTVTPPLATRTPPSVPSRPSSRPSTPHHSKSSTGATPELLSGSDSLLSGDVASHLHVQDALSAALSTQRSVAVPSGDLDSMAVTHYLYDSKLSSGLGSGEPGEAAKADARPEAIKEEPLEAGWVTNYLPPDASPSSPLRSPHLPSTPSVVRVAPPPPPPLPASKSPLPHAVPPPLPLRSDSAPTAAAFGFGSADGSSQRNSAPLPDPAAAASPRSHRRAASDFPRFLEPEARRRDSAGSGGMPRFHDLSAEQLTVGVPARSHSSPSRQTPSPVSHLSTPSSPISPVNLLPSVGSFSSDASLLAQGVVAEVWSGKGPVTRWGAQFVWWTPPASDAAGAKALGSLWWCDPRPDSSDAYQRRRTEGRYLLVQEVSHLYVQDLAPCPHSPFFARGAPVPSVRLSCCLSLLTDRSTFHVHFDSEATKADWTAALGLVLRRRKYIAESQTSPRADDTEPGANSALSPLAHLYSPSSLLTSRDAPTQYSATAAPAVVPTAALLTAGCMYCDFSPSQAWGGPRLLVAPSPAAAASSALLILSHDGRRQEPLLGCPSWLASAQLLSLCWHDKTSSLFLLAASHPPAGVVKAVRLEVRQDRVTRVLGEAPIRGYQHPPRTPLHCAASVDGQQLYVGLGAGVVELSNLEAGDAARLRALDAARSAAGPAVVSPVAVSAFGQFVVAVDLADAEVSSALLWDVQTGRWWRLLLRFIQRAVGLGFIRGTNYLLIVDAAGQVQVLDAGAVMKVVKELPQVVDLEQQRHFLMGRFHLLTADEQTTHRHALHSRAASLLTLSAVEGGVVTFVLPLHADSLSLRRWVLSPRTVDGLGQEVAPSTPSGGLGSSSSFSGWRAAGPSTARLTRHSSGRSKRLARLEGQLPVLCAHWLSADEHSLRLLSYRPEKRALYVVDCAALEDRKVAAKVEAITALAYHPLQERLYVCWATRQVEYLTLRMKDWPALQVSADLPLASREPLCSLPDVALAVVCGPQSRCLFFALKDRVVQWQTEPNAQHVRDFLPPQSHLSALTAVALLHGERLLLALDAGQRMVWRWSADSGQCLDAQPQLSITEPSDPTSPTSAPTSPRLTSVTSTRLCAFDAAADLVVLAGPADSAALWSVPRGDDRSGGAHWHRHWRLALDSPLTVRPLPSPSKLSLPFRRPQEGKGREEPAPSAVFGRLERRGKAQATPPTLSLAVVQADMAGHVALYHQRGSGSAAATGRAEEAKQRDARPS